MIPEIWDRPSLWDTLAAETRPIFLYGTGNGGDKIIDVCQTRGIRLEGVFASDGFVRSRVFRDMPVRAYRDVVENYGEDIVILLAFGTTLPEVTAFINTLNERHTLYIPEVPLYGGALFDRDLLTEVHPTLVGLRSLLADEHSRLLFDDAVLFRLTGEKKYLARATDPTEDIRALFADMPVRIMLDGGAFRGDSAAMYADAIPSLETIHAAEADARTFRHLSAYAETETRCQVIPHHCALWDSDGEITYTSSASRGSGTAGQNRRAKTVTVPTVTIDTLFRNIKPDLIKLDVEGAEDKALAGAENTLITYRPCAALSLYHRTEHLWTLPWLLHDLLPDKRLYLRRPPCIPFWDLTLFAV
ncbi:MAG: FkbM family methyltransferase [Clostridia bacterium]|nr:FkbM family methyltransferase [Clostridia bacterium]